MSEIIGSCVNNTMLHLRDIVQPQNFEMAAKNLSKEEWNILFNNKIPDDSYVDFATFLRFLMLMSHFTDAHHVTEAIRYEVRVRYHSVIQRIFSFISSYYWLDRLPDIWGDYFSSGYLSVHNEDEIKIVVSEFPMPEGHSEYLSLLFKEILRKDDLYIRHPICCKTGQDVCVWSFPF